MATRWKPPKLTAAQNAAVDQYLRDHVRVTMYDPRTGRSVVVREAPKGVLGKAAPKRRKRSSTAKAFDRWVERIEAEEGSPPKKRRRKRKSAAGLRAAGLERTATGQFVKSGSPKPRRRRKKSTRR